jgi:sugar lactone lactonase YvrE
MTASIFHSDDCELGEGVMWHSARKSFFWVDILEKKLYECRWADKKVTVRNFSFKVSLVIESDNSEMLLLGVQGGLVWLNLDSGLTCWKKEIEKDIAGNRTNDGGCDQAGRVWVGTMDGNCDPEAGALYCVNEKNVLSKKIDRMTIPNGIEWSPDGKFMYHVETYDRSVRAYHFDAATGDIQFSHIAINVPPEMGMPDGMCMDQQGNLWIAHWGGFGVYSWDPVAGTLLSKIEVPVPNVSSCAFGGDNMETLLITTAKEDLSAEDLQKYPDSGRTFIALPGVTGISGNKVPYTGNL